MSSGYSNQYDSAFRPQRLQNWCQTKRFKERPSAQEGHTSFIANDRGHLLPGVKKGSAWTDFKGTWDQPAHFLAHPINPTGRSTEGMERLKSWGSYPQHSARCPPHRGSRNTGRLQEGGEQQDCAAPSPAPKSRPASKDRLGTGDKRSSSQQQELQPGVEGTIGQPKKEKETQ